MPGNEFHYNIVVIFKSPNSNYFLLRILTTRVYYCIFIRAFGAVIYLILSLRDAVCLHVFVNACVRFFRGFSFFFTALAPRDHVIDTRRNFITVYRKLFLRHACPGGRRKSISFIIVGRRPISRGTAG